MRGGPYTGEARWCSRVLLVGESSLDTAFMLALEESMLLASGACGLCLAAVWADRPALVAGRTSRVEEEVDLGEAGRRGLEVYRRLSGGGTVYHDPGNLNLTLTLPRRLPVVEAHSLVAGLVARAVGALGLTPRVENEGDVVVGGWKLSGSAVYLAGHATLAHATLLVEADLDAAYATLRPLWSKIAGGEATPSKYRPANLASLSPGVAVGEAREALLAALSSAAPEGALQAGASLLAALHSAAAELEPLYRSGAWRLRGRRRQSFSFRAAARLVGGVLECPYTRGQGTTGPRSARL